MLGPQQQFLLEIENECKKWGAEFRGRKLEVITNYKKEESKSPTKKNEESKFEMSPEEQFVSMHGDHGQAERLVSAKKSNQSSPNSPTIPNKSPAGNRAQSHTPNSPVKGKVQSNNIFVKSAVRNITPGSVRSNYGRKFPK